MRMSKFGKLIEPKCMPYIKFEGPILQIYNDEHTHTGCLLIVDPGLNNKVENGYTRSFEIPMEEKLIKRDDPNKFYLYETENSRSRVLVNEALLLFNLNYGIVKKMDIHS